MKWASHVDCLGQQHSMRHFHDAIERFRLPPTVTRPAERTVAVHVTYGLHCFTRRPAANEPVRDCDVYRRNREGRLFCHARHALGQSLPGIVAGMGDRKCYLTDRRNRVLFSPITSDAGNDYAVFFALRRASEAVDWHANLMVLSAHARRGFRPGGKPDKFRDLLRALL